MSTSNTRPLFEPNSLEDLEAQERKAKAEARQLEQEIEQVTQDLIRLRQEKQQLDHLIAQQDKEDRYNGFWSRVAGRLFPSRWQ